PQRDAEPTPIGWHLRKEMMDDRCFRLIYADVDFDRDRNGVGGEVQGGTISSREEWLAEKDRPRGSGSSISEASSEPGVPGSARICLAAPLAVPERGEQKGQLQAEGVLGIGWVQARNLLDTVQAVDERVAVEMEQAGSAAHIPAGR